MNAMPRTEDIAATVGELHELLQDMSAEWADCLRGKLNPKVIYPLRAIALGLKAAAAGKIKWEAFGQYVQRVLDCDYKTGENSYRAQKELAGMLGWSERTARSYDAAIIDSGLATKRQTRRAPAVFTVIAPEKLNRIFAELCGPQDGAMADQEDVRPAAQQDLRPASQTAGQESLRPASQVAGQEAQDRQNPAVKTGKLGCRLPYTDHKKKEARTQTHERERQEPSVLDGAVASWVIHGEKGWGNEYRARFGNSPEYDDPPCRIYRHDATTVRRSLEYAELQVRKRGKLNDPYIATRLETMTRRLRAKEESGAPS